MMKTSITTHAAATASIMTQSQTSVTSSFASNSLAGDRSRSSSNNDQSQHRHRYHARTLDFESNPLDRSAHLKRLHALFQRRCRSLSAVKPEEPASSPPLAMVWGLSGTGKSHLVHTFCNEVRRASVKPPSQPYILHGKVDEYSGSNDPFAAIFQALNGFCRQFDDFVSDAAAAAAAGKASSGIPQASSSSREQEQFEQLKHRIQEKLGKRTLLTKLVPALSIFFQKTDGASTTAPSFSSSSSTSSINSVNQGGGHHDTTTNSDQTMSPSSLQYALTQLMQAIATPEHPVVLVLDDLQWASGTTLDLLHHLLVDRSLKYWIAVATVRQDINPHNNEILECSKDSPIMQFVDKVSSSYRPERNHQETGGVETLQLSNVTKLELEVWLRQLLSPPHGETKNVAPSSSRSLAQPHRKHHGAATSANNDEDARTKSSVGSATSTTVATLAEHLHNATEGNPLYIRHTMEEYVRTNRLVYSHISFRWEFTKSQHKGKNNNIPGANNDMMTNLLQLIRNKLQSQPAPVRNVLIVAAYIRSSFDHDTIQFVWNGMVKDSHGLDAFHHTAPLPAESSSSSSIGSTKKTANDHHATTPLSSLLEQAVLHGFLTNTIGNTTYSFAHDRFQQVAYDCVSYGEERGKFRSTIAKHLLQYCGFQAAGGGARRKDATGEGDHRQVAQSPPPVTDASLLFVAANHHNSVQSKHHVFTANLNVHVASYAFQIAALIPASAYLQTAATAIRKIKHLWSNHYDLALQYNETRCKVEYALGHFEMAESCCEQVLEHARTLDDKLPTYLTKAISLGGQDCHFEAFQLSKSVVLLLNEYPKRFRTIHIMKDLVAVRKFFKEKSDGEILSLPFKTDESKRTAMQFMLQLNIRAFMTQHILDATVNLLKMIRMSMRYGLCEFTPLAYTYYAMLAGGTGDQKLALRIASLARKILKKIGGHSQHGWTYFLTSAYVNAWSHPHTDVVQGLQHGHTAAMKSGEFEIGFINWQACNMHAFTAGFELRPLTKAGDEMIAQMKLYSVRSIYRMSREQIQGIKILSGEAPLIWKDIWSFGLSEEDKENASKSNSSDTYYLICGYWLRLQIAVYFRKYEWADELGQRFMVVSKHDESYNMMVSRTLFMGLAAAGRYRQTKEKRYMKQLQEMSQLLKKLNSTRGQNSLHRSLLLQAELKALKSKNVNKIRDAFDMAILVADKSGHIQDAALGCELLGDALLRDEELPSHSLLTTYFTRAAEYYQQWGCISKVQDLESRHGKYLDATRIAKCKRQHQVEEQGVVSTVGLKGSMLRADNDMSKRRTKIDLISAYTPAHTKMHDTTVMGGVYSSSGGASDLASGKENGIGNSGGSDGIGDDISVLSDMSA